MEINLPLGLEDIRSLKVGDEVLLSGKLLTARDAAHQKLITTINNGDELPVALAGTTIFYAGPIAHISDPNKLRSIGPTTSYRMDKFTNAMLERGVKGFIGKGKRADFVNESLQKFEAVYFIAIGGIAALLAKHIQYSQVVAYPELGTEAIRELTINQFPVIVATDSRGNSIYS